MENKWGHTFPLDVLFSPLLRLRYRVAIKEAIDNINKYYSKTILKSPLELDNRKLASKIEFDHISPPLGTIYACDRHCRALNSDILIFYNDFNKIQSAIICLPEFQEINFKKLTYNQLFDLV